MAAPAKKRLSDLFIDKTEIQKIVAETNRQMGIVPDPTITPQKVRQMMIDDGIRPEENLGSRGIIEAREE
jgi:hypothetical protein